MENELFKLKRQFCKIHCPNKNGADYFIDYNPCGFCKISEFIRFISDKL